MGAKERVVPEGAGAQGIDKADVWVAFRPPQTQGTRGQSVRWPESRLVPASLTTGVQGLAEGPAQ